MKLDYLTEGSPDCPILRIYAFSREEGRVLETNMRALAEGSEVTVRLGEILEIGSINIQDVSMRKGAVTGAEIAANGQVVWTLDGNQWTDAADRVHEVITSEAENVFHWLTGPQADSGLDKGSVSVLFSKSSQGLW